MMSFYKLTVVIFGLFVFSISLAASPVENKPNIPYEVFTITQQLENKQIYLGELTGDPHTYEFSLGKQVNLVIDLSQSNKEVFVPYSILVVKINENNRGVTEMGRVTGENGLWHENTDFGLGIPLLSMDTFTLELSPGIYRLEVSSAENAGKYMIIIGDGANDDGYFANLKGIRKVQSFFGYSTFRMLMSNQVFYPVGIVLLFGLFFITWRNRNRLTNLENHA